MSQLNISKKIKVVELEPKTQELLISLFKAYKDGFAKYGEGGYIFPATYKEHADAVRQMKLRPDDVWVTSFPRSGTTWTQEVVWLLKNDLDYKTAQEQLLVQRYSFLEFFVYGVDQWIGSKDLGNGEQLVELMKPTYINDDTPSPRFFKTHLPLSLLPPGLLDTGKVVYVARDPRDVAVSFYHLCKLYMGFNYIGDFRTFWNLFRTDSLLISPYFSHLKEAWARRDHPNMLFIFYEELSKDLPSCLRRIAKHLGKEYSSEQYSRLCEHVHFQNFKENVSVNLSALNLDPQFVNPKAEGFVRKGKVGGWRQHFDPEMTAEAEIWIKENLADSDLRFPISSQVRDLVSMYDKK